MRFTRKIVALFAMLTVAMVGSAVAPSASNAATTQQVPLTAVEAEFLKQLREANLYVARATQLAQVSSQSAEVRQTARVIAAQHRRLDVQLTQIANVNAVRLPAVVSVSQATLLSELSAAPAGIEFEIEFVRQMIFEISVIETQARVIANLTFNEEIEAFARRVQGIAAIELVQLSQLYQGAMAAQPQAAR